MKIGVIGPSKLNEEHKEVISNLAKIVSSKGHEIVVTPDKGSSSEFFAQEYLESGGERVYSIVPLDDKEFGIEGVNVDLGENINCEVWRNQPEKLNEECEVLLCIGYAAGGVIESCFIGLAIDESVIDGEASFSLKSVDNLYGYYPGLVPVDYGRGDYSLRVLNFNGDEIKSYDLYSSRFTIVETPGGESQGEIFETDKGIISIILSYSEDLSKVVVENNGTVSDLGIDPSQIICERTCKISGENGVFGLDKCCIGYNIVQTSENDFTCTSCGDNVCSQHEDIFDCPEDCGATLDSLFSQLIGSVEGFREGESSESLVVGLSRSWLLE